VTRVSWRCVDGAAKDWRGGGKVVASGGGAAGGCVGM